MTEKPRRLPIFHPDYIYPESLNPYYKKVRAPEVAGRLYSDNDSEKFRGQWREKFLDHAPSKGARRPLHVEIGCNGGHVLLGWAEKNPEHAYMGVDWKFKQIFLGAQKAAKKSRNNVIFLRAHAERIEFMFGPGEIDHLYLYFPDPWPKKAHWKNRYVTEGNLRRLAPLLSPEGVFHIKTDHLGYFEWMLEAIAKTQDLWEITEQSRDLHAGHPDPTILEIPAVTLFEKIFIRDQIPIKSVHLRRKS